MLDKLAFVRATTEQEGPPDKLMRDEILLVVVDAMMAATSGDIDATLDRWAAGK